MATHRLVGVPYTDEDDRRGRADAPRAGRPATATATAVLARYPGAAVGDFDGQPRVTEMDALVAYLQVLGTMVDFSTFTPDASR